MKNYGEHAVLIDARDSEHAQQIAAAIRRAAIGVIDVVPADRTVVVVADTIDDELRARLAAVRVEPLRETSQQHVFPVVYDGADLEEVARLTGLDAHEVVRRHTGAVYRVAFLGFAPGFGYLTGLDDQLRLHRRGTPRPKVPTGSVAIGGDYATVYPVASPGGWWLLGHTSVRLFDADRDPPALLAPGDTVRFEVA